MALKLLPPGKRGPCYYIRGTIGGRPIEMSCCTIDLAEAEALLAKVEAHYAPKLKARKVFLGAPDLPDRGAAEAERRDTPRAVELGAFEEWLQVSFELVGETIYWRADGTPVAFHLTDGYMVAKIQYGPWLKKVREHRLKFLLAHGWLPETIDHKDRIRSNNLLSNLEASTPARQIANTGPIVLRFPRKTGVD